LAETTRWPITKAAVREPGNGTLKQIAVGITARLRILVRHALKKMRASAFEVGTVRQTMGNIDFYRRILCQPESWEITGIKLDRAANKVVVHVSSASSVGLV